MKKVTEGDYDLDSEKWEAVSPQAKDLVRQLMHVDP